MKSQGAFVAAAVLAAVVLATVWALRMPVFQQPDEDSHYDYALTLEQAGRPLRPSENVVGRDTHPVVDYLMRATNARAQRLDGRVSAPPAYGSPAYDTALEAGAPHVDAASFRRAPIAPAPYIARLYPIGYYALAAGIIAWASWLQPGSVLAPFFATRFSSVAMLVPTLLLVWLSLRELRVRRSLAVLVLTSVALLPMTAWTAASVQPDNLAALLVAALTYAALRLKRDPRRLWSYALLGVLFALLVAVKRHYFVAALLPIAAMAAVRLRPKSEPRFAAAASALALLPSLVTFGLSAAWLHAAPPVTGVCHYDPTLGAPAPLDAPHFFAHGVWTALSGSFLFTQGLESFWLEYGAYRATTLSLGNATLDLLAVSFLPVASCALALLVALRLFGVWRRLARVALRRSPGSAARVATGNVLLNGYLTLFAIVTGYITAIGGVFGIQGRYWLPYAAGVFLCAYAVAPRALPRRYGDALGAIAATLVLAFEFLAAAGTVPSLTQRYYSPRAAPVLAEEILVSATVARHGGDVVVDGIGIDLRDAAPFESVALRVAGARAGPLVVATAVARPDVECKLEKGLLASGFRARVPETMLHPSGGRLEVLVKAPWTRGLVDSGTRVDVAGL